MLSNATPEVILKSRDFLEKAVLELSPFAPEIAHALATLALPLLPALAYARVEVQSIATLFLSGQATTYYESEATANTLWESLPRTTIAHFSCHGSFDSTSPLDSALYLAGGSRLTLRELLATDPSTLRGLALVVLSACQTAINDFVTLPNESIGLPAGFLQAGIPAVVGSLWPVNDFSTALLMVRFYELLLHGSPEDHRLPYSPAAALRAAQRWLREAHGADLERFVQRYPTLQVAAGGRWTENPLVRPFVDPYHWAAFIYLGLI